MRTRASLLLLPLFAAILSPLSLLIGEEAAAGVLIDRRDPVAPVFTGRQTARGIVDFRFAWNVAEMPAAVVAVVAVTAMAVVADLRPTAVGQRRTVPVRAVVEAVEG